MIYGEKTPQRPCVAMNPKVKYEVVAQGFGCEGSVVDVVKENGASNGPKTLESVKVAVRTLTSARQPSLLNLKVSDVPYQNTTKAMVSFCPALSPGLVDMRLTRRLGRRK